MWWSLSPLVVQKLTDVFDNKLWNPDSSTAIRMNLDFDKGIFLRPQDKALNYISTNKVIDS